MHKGYALKLDMKNLTTTYNTNALFSNRDLNTSVIGVQVTMGDIPINLTDARAYVNILKPDNTKIKNACEIIEPSEGGVVIHFTSQSLSAEGDNIFEIVLLLPDNQRLVSPKMSYKVIPSLESDSALESTNEYGVLIEIIQEVKVLKEELQEMIENGQIGGGSGEAGKSLEFTWEDTKLGIRQEGEDEYVFSELKGAKGDKGDDGASVYIKGSVLDEYELPETGVAGDGWLVDGNLHVWDELNKIWINVGNIKGAKGDKGDQGEVGPMGRTGNTGKTGVAGMDGKDGKDGIDGTNGKDGRGLNYQWKGTELGIKYEDEEVFNFVDLKGEDGKDGVITEIPDHRHKASDIDGLPSIGDLDTSKFVKSVNGLNPHTDGNVTIGDSDIECSDSIGYNKGTLDKYIDLFSVTSKTLEEHLKNPSGSDVDLSSIGQNIIPDSTGNYNIGEQGRVFKSVFTENLILNGERSGKSKLTLTSPMQPESDLVIENDPSNFGCFSVADSKDSKYMTFDKVDGNPTVVLPRKPIVDGVEVATMDDVKGIDKDEIFEVNQNIYIQQGKALAVKKKDGSVGTVAFIAQQKEDEEPTVYFGSFKTPVKFYSKGNPIIVDTAGSTPEYGQLVTSQNVASFVDEKLSEADSVSLGKGSAKTYGTYQSKPFYMHDALPPEVIDRQYKAGYGSVSIGGTIEGENYGASATSDYAISIGASSYSCGQHSMAFGISAKATANSTLAIGEGAEANTAETILIGKNSKTIGEGSSLSIGNNTTVGTKSLALGSSTIVEGTESISIGYGTNLECDNSIVIGSGNSCWSEDQTIIGSRVIPTGDPSDKIVFGIGEYNNGSPNHKNGMIIKDTGDVHICEAGAGVVLYAPNGDEVKLTVLNDGTLAYPQMSFITPMQFGAIGDGEADDTDALLKSIKMAEDTGKEVVLGNYKYKFNKTLKINNGIVFKGNGKKHTQLIFEPSKEYKVAILVSSDDCYLHSFTLSSSGDKKDGMDSIGICFADETNRSRLYTRVESIKIEKFSKSGIYVYAGWGRIFNHLDLLDSKYGMLIEALEKETIGYWSTSGDTFSHSYIIGCDTGVFVECAQQMNMNNVVTEYCTTPFHFVNCRDMKCTNMWQEANYGKSIIEGSAYFYGGFGINIEHFEHKTFTSADVLTLCTENSTRVYNRYGIVYEMIGGVINKMVVVDKKEGINLITNSKFDDFNGWETEVPYYVGVDKEVKSPNGFNTVKIDIPERSGEAYFGMYLKDKIGIPMNRVCKLSIKYKIENLESFTKEKAINISIPLIDANGTVVDYYLTQKVDLTEVTLGEWQEFTCEFTSSSDITTTCGCTVNATFDGQVWIAEPTIEIIKK